MDTNVSFNGSNFGLEVGVNHGTITNEFRTLDIENELPIAEGAAFDSFVNQHEEGCLPGTRTDILHDIDVWANSPKAKCLFWLNGMAGTGKSTIARTVARRFSNADAASLGASFFFKRGEADRGNAAKLFPTLVRQLVARIPQLRDPVRAAIKKDPEVRTKGLKDQFHKLVLQPLHELVDQPKDSKLNLLIVIDALDECDTDKDIRLILQLLPQLQTESLRLKVFLTSRPELPICLGFLRLSSDRYEDLILHEIPKEVIEHDISLFLEYRISEIRIERRLSPEWPGPARFENLVSLAIPLFIFAATMCRIFEDHHWDPEDSIEEIIAHKKDVSSSKLDGTYLPVLRRLLPDDSEHSSSQKAKLVEEFQQIVGSFIILETPFSVVSLSKLLELPESTITLRLALLHSVLNVPDDNTTPVRLFHLSFRDYLLDPDTRQKTPFAVERSKVHEFLALKCLAIGKKLLRKNICNLAWDGTTRSEVSQKTIDSQIPQELHYSCRYWILHLIESGNLEELKDQTLSFLREHFLHWMEAISWLGLASEAIHSIQLLTTTFESMNTIHSDYPESDILAFLVDMKRFIFNGIRPIIEEAPLQIYSSGLVFAPESSLVRRAFAKEIPTWISQLPQTESHWSSELQTLQSPSVPEKVAFSPNGLFIASWTGTNLDMDNVCLWDTATGTIQWTLKMSPPPEDLVFAPDSRTLTCTSTLEQSILTFDIFSGSLIQKWDHDFAKKVFCLTLSSDSSKIAGVHRVNFCVMVWDRTKNTPPLTLGTFKNRGYPMNLEFSQDNKLLSSHFYNGKVMIWDIATRTLSNEFELGRNGLSGKNGLDRNSVILCHDNCHLICDIDGLQLWNISTGLLERKFEKHANSDLHFLSISSDGKTIATISDGNLVELWSLETGTVERTFHRHTLCWLAISPNGQLLATAQGYQRTVMIWDFKSSILHGAHDLRSPVTSMASPSSFGTIVCGCQDSTIIIWSVTASIIICTLRGHSAPVINLAFSPNDSLLASAALDGSIILWDTTSYKYRYILHQAPRYYAAPILMSFSHDSRFLTCEYPAGWLNWQGEALFCILDTHTEVWRCAVEYSWLSPRGELMASKSPKDEILRLLDTDTGELQLFLNPAPVPTSYEVQSPQNRFLFSILSDGRVLLQGNDDSKETLQTLGLRKDISCMAFSYDDDVLAISLTKTHAIELWDTRTRSKRSIIRENSATVCAIAFSHTGSMIATGSIDKTIEIWNLPTGNLLGVCYGHFGAIYSLDFSLDDKLLASGSADKTVIIWDTSTRTQIKSLKGHPEAIFTVKISLCKNFLLSFSRDQTAILWELNQGKMWLQRKGLSSECLSTAFSGDNYGPGETRVQYTSRDLATSLTKTHATELSSSWSRDDISEAEIHWAEDGSDWTAFVFQGDPKPAPSHGVSISAVSFSVDGELLASVSSNGNVRVWDLAAKAIKWEGSHSRGEVRWEVRCLAFSPDKRKLASCSSSSIGIWDTDLGQLIRTLEISPKIFDLSFTEDGSKLILNGGVFRVDIGRDTSDMNLLGIEIKMASQQWVGINGKKLLWLPPKYRPRDDLSPSPGRVRSYLQLKGNVLAIVVEGSGEVIFIGFSM